MSDLLTGDVLTVRFSSLPEHTGATGLQLVAVHDNSETVRVAWDLLAAGFIHVSSTEPSGTTSQGSTLQCYIGEDGFYTWNQNGWGKSPRLTDHWDDTTPSASGSTARFLVVHKNQSLTPTELEQGRRNLGIDIASETSPGLVKQGTSSTAAPVYISDEGAMTVLPASSSSYGAVRVIGSDTDEPEDAPGLAVSYTYFLAKWQELPVYQLPPATFSTLGGILPSEDDFDLAYEGEPVGVVHAKKASYMYPGYVKKLDKDTWESEGDSLDSSAVPDYATVRAMIEEVEVQPADNEGTVVGTVRLSPVVYDDGGLTVRPASLDNAGITRVINSPLLSYEGSVSDAVTPTAYRVKEYVADAIDEFSGSIQFPTAYMDSLSKYTDGSVHPSETYFYFSSVTSEGSTYMEMRPRLATEATAGVVWTVTEYSVGGFHPEDAVKVPTVECLTGYVNEEVDGLVDRLQLLQDDINSVRGSYGTRYDNGVYSLIPYSRTSLYDLDTRLKRVENRLIEFDTRMDTAEADIIELKAKVRALERG